MGIQTLAGCGRKFLTRRRARQVSLLPLVFLSLISVSPTHCASVEEIVNALDSLGISGTARDWALCYLRPAVWGDYNANVNVPGQYVRDGSARKLDITDSTFSVQPGENRGLSASPWPEQLSLGSKDVAFDRGAPFFLSDVRVSGNTVSYLLSSNPSVTASAAYTSLETIDPTAVSDFTRFYRSWLGTAGISSNPSAQQLSFTLPWAILSQNTNLFALRTRGTNMTCLQSNSIDLNRPQATLADVVLNGASLVGGFASSAYVAIKGGNLSSTTRVWRQSDFVGNRLPTQLDGVSVSINGKPAYVYYVSPGQINALAPDDPAEGRVQVEVIAPQGRVTVKADKRRRSPAFFMFDPDGRKYLAAVHLDGSYLARPGLYSGLTTRPAMPGETIMLFGNGFGPTDPPTPAGELVNQPNRLASVVTLWVGGVWAEVEWAGVSGPGLYQFNMKVPAVPNGDHAVVAEIDGFRTQAGAYITVQQ